MGMTTNWAAHRVTELRRGGWDPNQPRIALGKPGGGRWFSDDLFGDGDKADGPRTGRAGGSDSLDADIAKFRAETGMDKVDSMLVDMKTSWVADAGTDHAQRAGHYDARFAKSMTDSEDMKAADGITDWDVENDPEIMQSWLMAATRDAVRDTYTEDSPEYREAADVTGNFDWTSDKGDQFLDDLVTAVGVHLGASGIQDHPKLWGVVARHTLGTHIKAKRQR